jgi:hypothetical protein
MVTGLLRLQDLPLPILAGLFDLCAAANPVNTSAIFTGAR